MTHNNAQSIAISHKDGPMLVLAGPGSGKTHVITKRIEYLIKEYKVRPEEILVITFTKYAAKEMKDRFSKQVGISYPVTFGTFHGVFYGILKWAYHINSENILSEDAKYKLIKEVLNSTELDENLDVEIEDEKDFIQQVAKEISTVKNTVGSIQEFQAQVCNPVVFRQLYNLYESKRKQYRKIDFDDMILQCYKLLYNNKDICLKWQEKFKYILIDEFQDINQVQFDTVQLLAAPQNNIFVVGDDDQSIYGFRGAKPEIMLKFTENYPTSKSVILEVNYRSSKAIVNAATRVIEHNITRYEKKVITPNAQGDNVHIQEVQNQMEESCYILKQLQLLQESGVPNSEVAVIFRTNLDARIIAAKMIDYGVPFHMREYLPNIYEHFIAQNIISYMQLVMGNYNRNHFLKIMNRPNRYIGRDAVVSGEVSFEDLRKYYYDKEWMLDRIDQLELDLRIMKNMTPYAMIQFLRKNIGYEAFLAEYAEFRKLDFRELLDTLDDIQEHSKAFTTYSEWLEHIILYEKQLKNQWKSRGNEDNVIALHTMHGAKGLEFDYVFMIGCNEGVTPSKKAKLPEEIEEERRMFYVAMTRARKKLTVIYPVEKHGKTISASRFVEEIM